MTLLQKRAFSSARRVVVTGIGAISPLGNSFEASWKALLNDECGITSLAEALQHQHDHAYLEEELELAATLPCQVAAPVRHCSSLERWTDSRTPRVVQFALHASKEALEHAGLFDEDADKAEKMNSIHLSERQQDRFGVSIGTGMSSVREIVQAYQLVSSRGSIRRLSPHFVPRVLGGNTAAGRIAQEFQLRGPNTCLSTACAASSHAILDAARFIQEGSADIMLAGGAEAALDPLSLGGFGRLQALSRRTVALKDSIRHGSEQQHSAPFDADRDGFVMGEGACMLVLEEWEHFVKRRHQNDATAGIRPLAFVSGYGVSSDAYHATSPSGDGAERAMRMALSIRKSMDGTHNEENSNGSNSNRDYKTVDFINAHATATPIGDQVEAKAIHSVVDSTQQNYNTATRNKTSSNNNASSPVLVSSTKGATGHLLGAAGALEAAFTVQSLVDQVVPHTYGLHQLDPNILQDCSVDNSRKGNNIVQFVEREPMHVSKALPPLRAGMSNSFGFGGTNAALVFERIDDADEEGL